MASPPLPIPTPDETSKWADHLFNEWKYRHESFWRTLYRFLGAIALLVTVPFVKTDYFRTMSGKHIQIWCVNMSMRGVYGSLPFIMFIALCAVLIYDHAKIKRVEQKLEKARGNYEPEKADLREAFKKRTCFVSIAFIIVGLGLLVFWALAF